MVDSLDVFVIPQKNSAPANPTRADVSGLKIQASEPVRVLSLTHLVDGEGALVPGVDLSGATSGEVEELDESGNHLVLLLRVTQTSVTAKTPAEDPLLRVQHQLDTQNQVRAGSEHP